MKHLLKMSDLTREELFHILDVADELKADRKAGRAHPLLAGKSLALIFAKPSTRTRASFQVGMYQLGGLAHYLNAVTEMQLGYGEAIEDTARTLGRYYDGIMIRTYKQSDAEALAQRAFGLDEVLPWQHISSGVHLSYLRLEHKRAFKEQTTPDCSFGTCTGCGLCPDYGIDVETQEARLG